MVKLTCTVCGREYEAVYSNKLYCSPKCKQAAWRAKKKAEALAEAAPVALARAELVAKLERFAPHTGALAREMISIAGVDCTELIVRLVAQAVREIGATSPVATNGATKAQASRAEGAPMK